MIIDAFLVFMVLAWAREHGRAIRLENLCRKCIEDMREWESKESARVEAAAPAPAVKESNLVQCTMCSKRLPVGAKAFSMFRKRAPDTKIALVCEACNSKFQGMMRA
jgi:hypothetical protein